MDKFFRDLFTGIDGKTYDPARVYGGIAVVGFMLLSIIATIYHKQPFNAQDYGLGFGLLLTGFGIGVMAKAKTEPQ